jgi:hypothetical protein
VSIYFAQDAARGGESIDLDSGLIAQSDGVGMQMISEFLAQCLQQFNLSVLLNYRI